MEMNSRPIQHAEKEFFATFSQGTVKMLGAQPLKNLTSTLLSTCGSYCYKI